MSSYLPMLASMMMKEHRVLLAMSSCLDCYNDDDSYSLKMPNRFSCDTVVVDDSHTSVAALLDVVESQMVVNAIRNHWFVS